jgi:serine/threonine-protein kinase
MVAAPRVGTTFAGYRIERVLGRGGMSVVYLAEHPRLKNAVALKLLAPALAEDDAFRERLIRESRLAASLNHPNVVPVYDTGEEDGVLFISMRYVDGPDLREVLQRGPLPLDQAVRVVSQVAAALDAAHARGLVHRDVKPANVLVEPATGEPPGHVFVSDFGLTKHSDARSGVTASGQFVGTIDYMAPEQIQGRQLDGRADVYALGCVLYECVTGQPPFRGENEVAVIWSHMRDDPPWPTDVDKHLPHALDGVVERALAKSPDDRYATAGELAADAAAAAATRRRRRSLGAMRLARLRRSRVRARSRRLVPLAVVALLGAAVAAAITAGVVSHSKTRTVRVPARPVLSDLDRGLVLRFVPAAVRRSCVHAAPLSPDFDASVVCHPGGAVEMVRYSHAISAGRMKQQLLGNIWSKGLAIPPGQPSPTGVCGRDPTAIRDWRETRPGQRTQLRGATANRPKKNGRLLCYDSGTGWSAIEWTDNRVEIYSIAYGTDRAALYRWWAARGGLEPVA